VRHHGTQLKSSSKAGIPEALAKVELYRYLSTSTRKPKIHLRRHNPIEPEQQLARRMLGIAIPGRSSEIHC